MLQNEQPATETPRELLAAHIEAIDFNGMTKTIQELPDFEDKETLLADISVLHQYHREGENHE